MNNIVIRATLIIHNAPFDLGFLDNELKLNGVKKKIQDLCPIIDTLELSKKQRPGTMHNLDALCRRFGVDTSARTRHGALLDAQILAQVYIANAIIKAVMTSFIFLLNMFLCIFAVRKGNKNN